MFIVITIIFFEAIIFVHEFGHFFVAKLFKVFVKEFSIGFGPCIFRRNKNNARFCFRVFPFGGFVDFDDESFNKLPILKRILIVASGALFNVLSGFLAIALVLVIQGQYNSLEVGGAKENFCCVKVGDEIKMVNGKSVFVANDFLSKVSSFDAYEPINLTVKRNGKQIELFDVGRVVKTPKGERKILGISLKVKKLNFLTFFEQSFKNFLFVLKSIFAMFLKIFNFEVFIKDFSGPVGLANVVGQAGKQGVCSLIFLFAFITVNVGIFNLFPFFALDGGQILFLVVEALFKKPINKNVQLFLNAIGFMVLTAIFVFVTLKDIFSLL